VTSTVRLQQQGRVQAHDVVVALTNILAPLIFFRGLFGYFHQREDDVSYNGENRFAGAPFVFGSLLR